MPFTFAHPAIVLPFLKIRTSYISASCLIIGSITPDFEYFLTMKATGRYSHTITGAFALDLPIAFSLVLIFHSLIKGPFIVNMPEYFHQRLTRLNEFNFIQNFRKNSIGYIVCLMIGIFSHILWDSFTHINSYGVNRFDELSRLVNISGLPTWPLYRYLQHLSTVGGVLIIVYFFHLQPTNPVKRGIRQGSYWVNILGLAGAVFCIRWIVGFEYFADIVASIISSLLLATIIISFIFTFRSK